MDVSGVVAVHLDAGDNLPNLLLAAIALLIELLRTDWIRRPSLQQVTIRGKHFSRAMTVRVGDLVVSGPPVLRTILVNASAERLFPVKLIGARVSAWQADVDSRHNVVRRRGKNALVLPGSGSGNESVAAVGEGPFTNEVAAQHGTESIFGSSSQESVGKLLAQSQADSRGTSNSTAAAACLAIKTQQECPQPCEWMTGKCMDSYTARKVKAGNRCPCIEANGVSQVSRLGQQYIVYKDSDGTEHYYPSSYGTQMCKAHDLTVPPDCADAAG